MHFNVSIKKSPFYSKNFLKISFNKMHSCILFLTYFYFMLNSNVTFASFVNIRQVNVQKLTWYGRAHYIRALMEEANEQKFDIYMSESNSITALSMPNDKCTPDLKFDRCCWQRHMWCPFYLFCNADEMRLTACKYPPGWLAWNCQMCLGFFINEYIECFTDGWYNRICCLEHGVPNECHYQTTISDCGDYCDADGWYTADNWRYQCCIYSYDEQISACNKQSSNMNFDTAAVRNGFCQRDCDPPWPVYCKL